ncbi:MAG TPA: DUF3105 domain-containing protein [Micromonosporaceae bacterium]|jgi:hypothetical protein|nr:DUF3105 domain-containing protein [Micromonosporaceae bacterium]
MTTPQGGNNRESGVIRITRKAVAGAGKAPKNRAADESLETDSVDVDDSSLDADSTVADLDEDELDTDEDESDDEDEDEDDDDLDDDEDDDLDGDDSDDDDESEDDASVAVSRGSGQRGAGARRSAGTRDRGGPAGKSGTAGRTGTAGGAGTTPAKKAAGAKAVLGKAVPGKAAPGKGVPAKSAPTTAPGKAAAARAAAQQRAAQAKGGSKTRPSKAPSKAPAKAASKAPAKVAGRNVGGQPVRRPGGSPGGHGGRRPPQVVVAKTRNWSRISLVTGAIVVFLVIVGYGGYAIYENGLTFEQRADKISGVVDYRKKDPAMLTRNHVTGVVNYKVSPPVGGDHNPNYQRCAADVYNAPIANENAVHALEHGSVWITYRPGLPASQIAQLTAEVKKYSDFILMSPYPGLSSPISLQAWGFQLKVNSASDSRIDKFVQDLRVNASMEPGIDCTSGNYVTATGTQPHNLGGPVAPSTPPSAPAAAPSQ